MFSHHCIDVIVEYIKKEINFDKWEQYYNKFDAVKIIIELIKKKKYFDDRITKEMIKYQILK